MGNCGSSCCKGSSRLEDYLAATDRYRRTGRSRDNLYEPQLADSEREAVSDLLAYLENVRKSREAPR